MHQPEQLQQQQQFTRPDSSYVPDDGYTNTSYAIKREKTLVEDQNKFLPEEDHNNNAVNNKEVFDGMIISIATTI
jgi:hypothetical protein